MSRIVKKILLGLRLTAVYRVCVSIVLFSRGILYKLGIKSPYKKLLTFTLFDGSKFDYPSNTVIAKVLSAGNFEKTELQYLTKTLKNGDTFFDIGANGGIFSIIASRIVQDNGLVYAFEPGMLEHKLLVHNIKKNHLENVKIFDYALSNESGKSEFFISQDGAMNSLSPNKHPLQHIYKKVVVNTITLDDFIQKFNVKKIDFIKIDVEGAEKFVFEGGKKFFSNNKNVTILFEAVDLNSIGFNYNIQAFLSKLLYNGFKLYYLDELSNEIEIQSVNDKRYGNIIYNFIAKV